MQDVLRRLAGAGGVVEGRLVRRAPRFAAEGELTLVDTAPRGLLRASRPGPSLCVFL